MFDLPQVKKLIQLSLEEDLGSGDVTTELTVPEDRKAQALLRAKEQLVFCGGGVAAAVFHELGWSVQVEVLVAEGELVEPGTELLRLKGKAHHLLSAERTILNFLQRLSGAATNARRYAEAAPQIVVLDTRKTTPGWRLLEKYAVRTGGARNHRFHLGDMILVKDNHIDANGGDINRTLQSVFDSKPYYIAVEVEVRSLDELKAVLEFPVDGVMLDNMDDAQLKKCLELLQNKAPQVRAEVSGGITIERLSALQDLGVKCVSCGALTHSAPSVDISMRIDL